MGDLAGGNSRRGTLGDSGVENNQKGTVVKNTCGEQMVPSKFLLAKETKNCHMYIHIYIYIYIVRYGYIDMKVGICCAWICGYGYVSLWIYGYGYMDVGIWILCMWTWVCMDIWICG